MKKNWLVRIAEGNGNREEDKNYVLDALKNNDTSTLEHIEWLIGNLDMEQEAFVGGIHDAIKEFGEANAIKAFKNALTPRNYIFLLCDLANYGYFIDIVKSKKDADALWNKLDDEDYPDNTLFKY